MIVQNFLTFDIEEWYHANYEGYEPKASWLRETTHLEALTDVLLAYCDRVGAKTTFFVVGEVAKKYPHMVRRIASGGHELASHSFHHELVHSMGPQKFFEDLKKTKQLIEDISNQPVVGFRAPSWSVTKSSLKWYYSALKKAGYSYSSSIFPIQTFLYGIPGAKTTPHTVAHSLLEIPCSTANFLGKRIGFSGGAYMRFLPLKILQGLVNQVNSTGTPVVFYLHPREIDVLQPVLDLPLQERLIHYYGVNTCSKKLCTVLSSQASSFGQTLAEYVMLQQ